MPAESLESLARDELPAVAAGELAALKARIRERLGLPAEGYKEKCFRRRVAIRLRARQVRSYAEYGRILDRDPVEADHLLQALMINVSKFFRNPEVWAAVRDRVLPALPRRGGAGVRVWSAGTADGEEAYSAAILFMEFAAARRAHGSTADFQVLGTDFDGRSLQLARLGEYGQAALVDSPATVRARWFEPVVPGLPAEPNTIASAAEPNTIASPASPASPTRWKVRAEVRERVRFREDDLLEGRLPARQDLVFCRNVLIYFERAAQEALLLRLAEALAPGGFLVLGQAESLVGAGAAAFRPVAERERIYQRR